MRRRPTWVHWTVAGIIVVIALPMTVAISIRVAGFARYDQTIAELKARGEPASARDLLASAPAVDEERQERWWTWSQTPGIGEFDVESKELVTWLAQRDAPLPAAADAQLAAADAWIRRGRALLGQGPIDASTLGFLHRDLARLEADPDMIDRLRMPSLLSLREFANALELAALRGDGDALEDLDRLLAAIDRPATLIDAMIAVVLGRIRDEAYLRLAWRGTIDRERLAAYIDERPRDVAWLAAGIRGERLMFLPLAVERSQRRPIHTAFTDQDFSQHRWWHPLSAFLFAGGDAAVSERLQRDLERRLTGDGAWPDVERAIASLHAPFASSQRTIAWCPTTAASADALHRAVRAAARLLMIGFDAAPSDEAAFAAAVGHSLLDASADRYGLVYTRLADRRVRIAIDRATRPDFSLRPMTSAVAARSTWPVAIGGESVEIDLPPPR